MAEPGVPSICSINEGKTKRQDPVDILPQKCAILGLSCQIHVQQILLFLVPLLLKIQQIQKNQKTKENSELHIFIYYIYIYK